MSTLSQMVVHDDQIHVPRQVVWLTAAMVTIAIVAVALGRLLQLGVTHEGALQPTRTASFRFSQSLHGPVVATTADGRRVTLAGANEELFPRLILRSVATIRARDGVDPAAPMRLIAMADGERLLIDPATRHILRLAAFGPVNQRDFDRLFGGRP